MEEPDFRDFEISIVGLGLIGGSYALALRKMNPKKIWGIDIDRDTLEQAENKGIIDGGFIDGALALKRSDLVVICVYPELTVKFVRENLAHFKAGAVITDSAGIKRKVMDEIQTFLREDLDFIGGHPLAGKECSGFAHASSDIFGRANYIITPVPNNRKESLDLVEKMVLGIGCREPIYMSPGRHDEIIALTSQLPHIIAAALINSSEYENTGSLVGGSFKDATRVARMNVPLWSELFLENRENVLNQIDRFLDHMTSLKMSILQQDQDALNKLLNRANSARIKF